MNWLKKIGEYGVVLLIILTINFFVPRLMPGDPFYFLDMDDEMSYSDVFLTEETREELMRYYSLDRPLHEQYLHYISNVLQGEMGISIRHNMKVSAMILCSIPWTILLMGVGFILATVLGILLGAFSAWNRESKADRFLMFSMVALSRIPIFILAVFMLILLAANLRLFPLGGAITPYVEYSHGWLKVADIARHLFLPALTLAVGDIASPYLLTRNTMISVIRKDYVWAARARGLKERLIRFRYALRNALIPVVTARFMSLGQLLGGSVFVENTFAYPGLGKLLFDSIRIHDYPVSSAILLIMSVCIIIANLFADQFIYYLDKRVERHAK
jgi:peptide/nickel transport system permease protein